MLKSSAFECVTNFKCSTVVILSLHTINSIATVNKLHDKVHEHKSNDKTGFCRQKCHQNTTTEKWVNSRCLSHNRELLYVRSFIQFNHQPVLCIRNIHKRDLEIHFSSYFKFLHTNQMKKNSYFKKRFLNCIIFPRNCDVRITMTHAHRENNRFICRLKYNFNYTYNKPKSAQ